MTQFASFINAGPTLEGLTQYPPLTYICVSKLGQHVWCNSLSPVLRQASTWTNTDFPDNKVHGTNMGPTWVLSAPGGPHVCPINLAIRLLLFGPMITNFQVMNWRPVAHGHYLSQCPLDPQKQTSETKYKYCTKISPDYVVCNCDI